MRPLNALLSELERLGVLVWEEAGRLGYKAPKGSLSRELLEELRARKHEVLESLRLGRPPAVGEIGRADRTQPLPLSFGQERLWFVDQLSPGSPAWNVTGALRIEGALDLGVLERCLNEVVRRHDVLRTTFAHEPVAALAGAPTGEHYQVIHPFAPFSLPVSQVPVCDAAELHAAEQRQLQAAAAVGFDLARGPIYRFAVVRFTASPSPRDSGTPPFPPAPIHLLIIVIHHIAVDEWSIRVLFQEVSALYAAIRAGQPASISALRVQYADYAAFERRWLESTEAAASRSYWQAQLARLPVTQVPPDHPPAGPIGWAGVYHTQSLPAALAAALRQLGVRHGATTFMTLAAALGCLLQFVTKQDDMVIGTDVANREHTALLPLIGFFTNQVVLRADLRGDPTFAELLMRMRERTLSAYAQQRYPFHLLAAELDKERRSALATLFHIKLSLVVQSDMALPLPGLRVEPVAFPARHVRETFGFLFNEVAHGMELQICARSDLYEAATLSRLGQLFETLLGEVTAQPDCRLSQLRDRLDRADAVLQRQRADSARAAAHNKLKARRREAAAAPTETNGGGGRS